VAEKLRIGEMLLLQEKIDPWLLSHTLKEQAESGNQQRLISMFVSRAQLELDEGALLLSEQLGYPAALQRHFERREADVLALLPPQLGSRWACLPLARARTGAIVVLARDPTPILAAALEHAMRSSVVLAVAPSVQVERMVRAAYGVPGEPEDPLPDIVQPTLSDIGEVQLEDETPLPIRRARTVSYMFKGLPDLLRTAFVRGQLETILIEIDRAITAVAVERLVMLYVAGRWKSAVLFRIDGDNAIGLRGHGVAQPQEISIDLTEPSLLSLAHQARRPISAGSDVPPHAALDDVLGHTTAAAPVLAGAAVRAVLVVGDVSEGAPQDAVAELDRLVDALGAAYDRFSR
jgi:hypothetical protein